MVEPDPPGRPSAAIESTAQDANAAEPGQVAPPGQVTPPSQVTPSVKVAPPDPGTKDQFMAGLRGAWTRWIPGVLMLALAVVAAVIAIQWEPPPLPTPGAAMSIDFGYEQAARTRTLTYFLCRPEATYPECSEQVPETRPEVTSATLAGDLTLVSVVDGDAVCDGASGQAFPSQQITSSAANFDRQGLVINVTADPVSPEAVLPGAYCGTLVVARSAGDTIQLPIVVSIQNRYDASIVYRVSVWLLLGAAAGALLKWLGNNVGPSVTGRTTAGDDTARNDGLLSLFRVNAGLVLGAATAVAVAIVGVQTQFVGDTTFNNSFLDYFGLLAWAFTGQIAGQTLFEVGGATRAARST